MPLTAMRLACAGSFSPSARLISAFMPTPKPTANEISRFCIGNASETAVSAFSLILDTNTLSTTLYSAWTSIEIIIGTAMDSSSLLTGITPILFSAWSVSSKISSPLYKFNHRLSHIFYIVNPHFAQKTRIFDTSDASIS